MSTKIGGGVIETEVFTSEEGYVVIRQPAPDAGAEQACMLSADQLPDLIRELQALYDARERWREPTVE